MTIHSLLTLAVIASGIVTASALAENKPGLEALSEETLDIDNYGKKDRAVLVGYPASKGKRPKASEF